jgi:hypothetical protein
MPRENMVAMQEALEQFNGKRLAQVLVAWASRPCI